MSTSHRYNVVSFTPFLYHFPTCSTRLPNPFSSSFHSCLLRFPLLSLLLSVRPSVRPSFIHPFINQSIQPTHPLIHPYIFLFTPLLMHSSFHHFASTASPLSRCQLLPSLFPCTLIKSSF